MPSPDDHAHELRAAAQRLAVELFNEISDQLVSHDSERVSIKLYLEQTYDGGASGASQILVEGCVNDELIWVAQLAREKGLHVTLDRQGLLINVAGRGNHWEG